MAIGDDAVRITEFTEAASTAETDLIYLVRGTGAGADYHVQAVNGLIPKYLTLTGTTAIDLSTYGGDLTIMVSGTFTLTFTNELLVGKQLVIMNKGTGIVTCAGTVVGTILDNESYHGVSDGSAMYITRYISKDASGNVGIGVTPTSLLHVGKNQNTSTAIKISNTTSGTGAQVGLELTSNTATGFVRAHSTGYTAVAGWADLIAVGANGTATNGLVLYSENERIRFQGASQATRMELNNNVLALSTNTVKTWGATYNAFEVGGTASLFADADRTGGNGLTLGQNIYNDGAFKRIVIDEVSYYTQSSGRHIWYSDISGTADVGFTPTQRMQLNLVGQLLIGTAVAPSSTTRKQVLYGSATASYTAYQTAASGTGDASGSLVGINDTNGLRLWNYESTGISFGTSNVERMTISAAGDLAINTNKFTVAYSTGNTLVAGTLTSTGVATFNNTVDINAALTTRGITLDSGNNLTVTNGTATVTGTIDLNGLFDLDRDANNYAAFIDNPNTNAGGVRITTSTAGITNEALLVQSSSGIVLAVRNNGHLRSPTTYGKTSASAANMFIDSNGDMWRSTSSRKYKEKERPLEMDTSKVYDVELCTFDMKGSGEVGHGPIAEDIAEVEPNFATYDRDNKPEAIHTNNVLYALLNEVQTHKKANIELTDTVLALEARLIKLEGGE